MPTNDNLCNFRFKLNKNNNNNNGILNERTKNIKSYCLQLAHCIHKPPSERGRYDVDDDGRNETSEMRRGNDDMVRSCSRRVGSRIPFSFEF